MKITYKIMTSESDADIPYIKSIYRMPEVAKYLSISENFFHYVTNNEDVFYYKIYVNNTVVAVTHLEKQGKVLCMHILVFPEFQGMGIGRQIVEDIQKDIFGFAYDRIEVFVDERNIASVKLFEGAGFVFASKEDGLIKYTYQMQKG